MTRPWARDNAVAFASALDGRGPRNSELQDLVRFAESLCEAAVEPSAEFLQSLRAELMTDAATVLVATRKTEGPFAETTVQHPVRRRLAVATATLVTTAGMLSIVASSAQALPGEMLYPVKRGVESVQLTMHQSDASRGSFELAQATERLAEAKSLASQGDARSDDLVARSLDDFTEKASSGSESLFADYTEGGDDTSIDKVTSFATSSSTVLSDLSGNLSPDAGSAFRQAASTVSDLASQASELCGECESARLSSLATSVASFIADTGKPPSAGSSSTTAESPASDLPVAGSSVTTTPPKSPIIVVPAVPTPSAVGGSAPLLGTLLGEDDQVSLVPVLLNGLLGTTK